MTTDRRTKAQLLATMEAMEEDQEVEEARANLRELQLLRELNQALLIIISLEELTDAQRRQTHRFLRLRGEQTDGVV